MSKYYLQYTMDDVYGDPCECAVTLECTHDELQDSIRQIREQEGYNIQVTEEE